MIIQKTRFFYAINLPLIFTVYDDSEGGSKDEPTYYFHSCIVLKKFFSRIRGRKNGSRMHILYKNINKNGGNRT